MPQLSIITINRNNSFGIKRTLASIISQSANDFEYIVIDGASTDESKNIICQYADMPMKCIFNWISEPDSGIYNAMNKGIKMASGKFLLFINSGDELADNHVIENFLTTVKPESEICSGSLLLINDSEQLKLEAPNEISLSFCLNAGLTHPNTFIRKSLFDKYGLYNEANKIVSDWEFFLIAAGLNTCKYQKLNFTVALFYEDGISTQNKELVNLEVQQAIDRLVPNTILNDIKRLNTVENQLSQPAFQVIQKTPFIRSILEFVYRFRKKLNRNTDAYN